MSQARPRYIELFDTNDQKLLKNWKIQTSVQKVYDKESRTFVYSLQGSSPVPLMYLPKEKKDNLCIFHPFVVFQICFGVDGYNFFDFYVTSVKNVRRRITLSSKQKIDSVTCLSAQLPLSVDKESKWTHLLIDLESIVTSAWKNERFSSINCLRIGGSCKLKRVFALRQDMKNWISGSSMISYNLLPNRLSLSENIPQCYQYISFCGSDSEVCKYEVKNNDICLRKSAASSVSSFKRNSSKSATSPERLSVKSTTKCMSKESIMLADNHVAVKNESEKEISRNFIIVENNSFALPSILSKLSFLESMSNSNEDAICYNSQELIL